MKQIFACIVLVFLTATLAYGGAEYVTVVKVLDNSDKGIIERQNGERWLIEKGVGALSFWRFEGKQIIIYSPGIFCGVGSKVILPDMDQEARIWNAERLANSSSSPSTPALDEAKITLLALVFIGYYDPKSTDNIKSNVVLALKQFQKQNDLPQNGKISPDVQIALFNAVNARKPQTDESIGLALDLLSSAKRIKTGSTSTFVEKETFITEVSSDGSIVQLADGSIYEIDIIGQIKTMLWLPTQRVLRLGDGLLHLGRGQKVKATLLKE